MLGPPVGIPKTGVFGFLDLVGIDLIPQGGRQYGAAAAGHGPAVERTAATSR